MARVTNPVKGHIPCPICQTISTVHQAGEGKLIAEGEPLKNGRNTGLKYYKCPECGNSAISKSVNEYIEAVLNSVDLTVEPLDETVNVTGHLTGTPENSEPSQDKVSNSKVTVSETVTQADDDEAEAFLSPVVKRVLIALGLLAMVIWLIRRLVPKARLKQGEDDAATA